MVYDNLGVEYGETTTVKETYEFPEFVGKGYFEFVEFLETNSNNEIKSLRPETIHSVDMTDETVFLGRIRVHIDGTGIILSTPING